MTTTFSYTDPKELLGDPFEVAAKSVKQTEAIFDVAFQALNDVWVLARNAELERQLQQGGEVDVRAWDESPQARKIDGLQKSVAAAGHQLSALRAAVGYNPKQPPKE